MKTVLPCSFWESSLSKLVKSVPNVLVHNSMHISRNILSSMVTPPRNWDPTCLVHFCQDTRHQDPTISHIKDMLTHRASSLRISRNYYHHDFFKFQSSNFSLFAHELSSLKSINSNWEFILSPTLVLVKDLFNRTIE